MKPCLAIDLGGTKIAAALVSSDEEITERRQVSTPHSATPEQLRLILAQLIESYTDKASQLAVASTGIINNGNLTALNPANLGGLNHFPLTDVLKELSGLPVTVINDAQAAGWAEYHYLSSRSPEIKTMAFITVSTGVGGGIVSNGELLTGNHGIAGHIGHTLSDPNGPLCGCGRQGCVEAIASGSAIAAMAGGSLVGRQCPEIFKLAREGNDDALALINRSASAIAQLIADIKIALDVELVVIGGSVGLAEGYLERVRYYSELLPVPFQVPLLTAHYRQNAGLLGAAKWALAKI